MLLENGVYGAVVRDISVYLRGDNERLTAAFRIECEGKEIVHREWLELNDGTISDRTIRRLRDCFPEWDGAIESLEQGFCVQDVEVEVTIENEQDRNDPEKWWTRVRFMDPPGSGGGAAALPEKVSRGTLVSKYGSRFRALAGGTPAKPAGDQRPEVGDQKTDVAAPTSQRKATLAERAQATREEETRKAETGGQRSDMPPPSPRANVIAEPSSLEDCWEALCNKHPDELREQVSERWFKLLERTGRGKDQADFNPADWGRVMAEIKLPF